MLVFVIDALFVNVYDVKQKKIAQGDVNILSQSWHFHFFAVFTETTHRIDKILSNS